MTEDKMDEAQLISLEFLYEGFRKRVETLVEEEMNHIRAVMKLAPLPNKPNEYNKLVLRVEELQRRLDFVEKGYKAKIAQLEKEKQDILTASGAKAAVMEEDIRNAIKVLDNIMEDDSK